MRGLNELVCLSRYWPLHIKGDEYCDVEILLCGLVILAPGKIAVHTHTL